MSQEPQQPSSPKDVTQITMESIDMTIRNHVITVFKDVIDGIYSVIEEYEDDPEWCEQSVDEDVDLVMEEDASKEEEEEEEATVPTTPQPLPKVNSATPMFRSASVAIPAAVETQEPQGGLTACSTCGKKKTAEEFGYKSENVLYKSCTECRDKKKRHYEQVRKCFNCESSSGSKKRKTPCFCAEATVAKKVTPSFPAAAGATKDVATVQGQSINCIVS